MRAHRYVLAAFAASALIVGFADAGGTADRSFYKAPRSAVALYNWSGLYLGGNVGYGFAHSSWTDDPTLTGLPLGFHDSDGAVLGGQVGFNIQSGPWVAGVEADLDWALLRGEHIDATTAKFITKVAAVGTAAARAGYAVDRIFFFAKGGAAAARFEYENFTAAGTLNGANTTTRWGWMVGGGFEYGWNPNWSIKFEYNYLDFASKTLPFSGGVGGAFVQTISNDIQLVKLGINYRIGR